jgi:hypothetical protein
VRRFVALGALVVGLLAVGAPTAGARPDASLATLIKGTATFPLTEGSTNCTFAQEASKVREHCVPPFGVFTGTPGRAGASVGWTWLLEVVNGAQTGNGTEQLTLKLNFGGGKTVTLDCKGKLRPSGPQTAAGGTIVGTGNCVVRKAAGFARTLDMALKGKCKTAAGKKGCKYKATYKRTGGHYDGPSINVQIND